MIYFLRHINTGLIKIGYSDQFCRRLLVHLRKFGALENLGFMDGTMQDEKAIHRRFRYANQRWDVTGLLGVEWYESAPELVEFIEVNAVMIPPISRLMNGIDTETIRVGKAVKLARWLGVKVDELYEVKEPA